MMSLVNIKVGDEVAKCDSCGDPYMIVKVVKVTAKRISAGGDLFSRKTGCGVGIREMVSADPEIIQAIRRRLAQKESKRTDHEAKRAAIESEPRWQAASRLMTVVGSKSTDELAERFTEQQLADACRALGLEID